MSWHRLSAAITAEVDSGFLTEDQAADLIEQLPASTAEPLAADQLDAAILDALRQVDGEAAPWAALRAMLPEKRTSRTADALVRLVDSGQVHVVKVDGRNYVALSITLGSPS
ncbi:hypothetical protein BVC93_24425 [Mycobacterium sp. MS1601]|nr:hypothetical protein BVC93_24425 [Mycobacterium sp. MS1601]